MKKLFLAIVIVITTCIFTSCREKETKVIVQEKTVETTEEERERRMWEDQGVGEEVDKEVNEEIDEEIEKIGNDDQ